MEFLYPPARNDGRLMLIMVISRSSEKHVVCYDWDSFRDIRLRPPKIMGGKLSSRCSLPLFLIPLTKITSFLVVTTKSMFLYQHLAQASKMPSPTRLPFDIQDSSPGSSLLWTAWARPMRNSGRNSKYDDIYLCREDGHVLYMEISHKASPSIVSMDCRTLLGPLSCNVDTAFTIIDGGFEAGDLLVVSGSKGDGGLYVGYARQSLRCVQKIPNWAPVLDSTTIKATNSQNENHIDHGYRSVDYSPDRIFVCSDAGPGKDSVTELRNGLEAQIGFLIDQDESPGVLDMWAIPDTGGTFFLFSGALSSSLILIQVDGGEGEDACALDEDSVGISFGAQTLAAGATPEGVLIQITNSSVHLSLLRDTSIRQSEKCQDSSQQVVAGAVHGQLSLFAVAIRNGDSMSASVRRVSIDGNSLCISPVGEPVDLIYEPLCFAIEQLGPYPFLFVGTSGGKILVSKIDGDNGLIPLFEKTITIHTESDEPKACECLRVNTTQAHGSQKSTLFCGLRNGSVVPFEIDLHKSPGSLGKHH